MQLHAQEQNYYMTNNEIQSFLDSMIVHKDQFIGKTMGEIYLLFEQVRLPMRHFSYGEKAQREIISYIYFIIYRNLRGHE